MNLYLNENITVLLNSTTFMNAKPVAQNYVFSSNKESSFLVNITINTTNVFNYNYIGQIIVDINDPSVNEELLSYSMVMNFNDILKNNKGKKKDNKEKILATSLVSVVSVFVIISIIVFRYIS